MKTLEFRQDHCQMGNTNEHTQQLGSSRGHGLYMFMNANREIYTHNSYKRALCCLFSGDDRCETLGKEHGDSGKNDCYDIMCTEG